MKISTTNSHQQATSIQAPPDRVPETAPVSTVSQVLPFGELTWENFERLCHRLASQDSEVEHSARYGIAGQAQQGIDIFARKKNGKYDTWQAKRYASYSPSNLRTAVSAFLKGNWVAKSETFFIAVQASLSNTKVQDEIEEQTAILKRKGISLVVLGAEELSERLRRYPRLLLDFFGRPWTKAFIGDSIDQALLNTLDGSEIARVRAQLVRVYQTQFQLLDSGAVEISDLSSRSDLEHEHGLLARFTRPDMLVRELRDATTSATQRDSANAQRASKANQAQSESDAPNKVVQRIRRMPLAGWITQSDQLAILGDAGTGKSTVLRCIALDLLGDQAGLPEIATRWGSLIPVYVSFAKWARTAEETKGQVGLKDVIRTSLQPLFTTPDLVGLLDCAIDERRILLLVDGLDEWSNEQAARTALQTLLTFVGTHQIPIIVTARPSGLKKIGAIPRNWSTGTLAPLSVDQQRRLVLRCLGQTVAEGTTAVASPDPSVNMVAERFFRDLKREAGLATLAEIPLLLVSLLALSLRRITLPKKRAQALDQLIDILLEIHPQSRATAAGDVQARFKVAQDTELRKGAVAALAYASRHDGGDAGYPTSMAKNKIKEFLIDPETHAFGREKAGEAANEILAVNAETIGLLVEKGPSEIGFVHASLEEYLAAFHIQSWPLEKLVSFIRSNATNVRWRNVIGNLISITRRPAEIDQFVDAIESAEADVLGESTRNQLLTDIAFSSSKMSPATATRLGHHSLSLIEWPGAIGERVALLSSALNGTIHPVLGPILLERVQYWVPRTLDYTEQFFEVLGTWDQAPDLLLVLKRGLVEQSRWGQRPAARAMAKVFGGSEEVRQWLISVLNGTTDLQSTGAAIEALVRGWPSADGFDQIIADTRASLKPSLRLIAIWTLVKLGQHDERHLSELLDLLEASRDLDYLDRPLAWEALSTAWLNHPIAIERCLQSLGGISYRMQRGSLDREPCTRFLLNCSPGNKNIRQWIVDELRNDHPFSSIHSAWDSLAPFALADDAIKTGLVAAITDKKTEGREYQISGLIAILNDQRLKDFAIQKVRSAVASWSHVWYLQPLINGWSSDHAVLALLEEIRAWPDEKLDEVVTLLPKILPDRRVCRDRLLSICRSQKPRRTHLLADVFHEIGCDWNDQEVVDELLEIAKSNVWLDSGSASLILRFGKNPLVQTFARNRLLERAPPLAAIAAAYPHIQDLRTGALSRVGALPTSLRYILAEVASIDSEHHAVMADILNRYDWEVDGDLKVLLSIRRHELLHSSQADATKAIETLLTDVRSVGHDFEGRRAAAVAGLIAFGAIKEFASLREGDKPLAISVGRYDQESGALIELIARSWDELKAHLGEELIERIGRNSSPENVWDVLAPYLIWNDGLRQEFVGYCELANSSLGIPSLRALARERPNSDLLERHCLLAVAMTDERGMRSPWTTRAQKFEAAYILHEQFGARPDISRSLHDSLMKRKDGYRAMVLAIYDPGHDVFGTLKISPLMLGTDHHDWATACTISAGTQVSSEFIEVLRAMINRDTHDLWDFQEYTNIAVLGRLARDPEAVKLLMHVLAGEVTGSEAASLSRYLAATGPFDDAVLSALRKKLDFFSRRKGVVVAGYDALANEIRPISHSLLDALQ